MKTALRLSVPVLFSILAFGASAPLAFAATINIDNLQPSWTATGGEGVYSAYYGPLNGYVAVSPGVTTIYDGRAAGIIKAGLAADADTHYSDEGLLGFQVPAMDFSTFAGQVLTYDVQNQTGTNPVWVRIRLTDANQTEYQFVPTLYSAGVWNTVNAAAGQWQMMDANGNGTGPLMSLSAVAATSTGLMVDRVYLTLGMGDSYHVSPGVGTVAWVDTVTIGGTTYDFTVTLPTTPSLGTAATFGILSSTFTPSLGLTAVTGDLGYTTLSAGTFTVTGATHIGDSVYTQAGSAQGSVLSALASNACTFTFADGPIDLAADTTHGTIGAYTPGVYCVNGAATIGTAGISLNGSGTYIFRIVGALNSVANSNVTLNGASASDVFWTPTAATTLGATAHFEGTVIDAAGITVGANTTWTGRALAYGGTVTTNTDTISVTAPAPACTTTCYVAANGNDTNGGTSTSDAKKTIQAAITQVNAGGTINVAAGIYTETGQIIINKNISIVGADKTTTIIKPAQNTGDTNSGDLRGWFLVNSGKTFNLSKVTLDGSGKLIAMGILSHGNGTIENNIIKNIGYNPSTDYYGRGIELYDTNMTVRNNTLQNIGRIGIFGYGSGVTSAIIDGNNYTGKGIGDWLDYGIELGGGAVASITNNAISNCIGVASVDGSTSAGIAVTTYFAPGTTATITGNTLTGNTDGIGVGYDASDTSVVVAHNNTISGNTDSGIVSTHPTVDATNNWWGNASGPLATTTPVLNSTGTGNAAVGNISYSPWYTDSLLNHLKATITTSIDNEASTTIPTATTQSGSDNNGGTVTADIPSGTVVTGDSSWDGVISAPTPPITTPTVTIPNFDTTVTSAFTVGSTLSDLTFDNAVKLTFAGQAGTLVGYYDHVGTFATIAACSTINAGPYDQAWADNVTNLAIGADCTFNSGSDLIVWTKHFSTFVTYTQTPTQTSSASTQTSTPVTVSSGGISYGAGGGYANPLPGATIATTAAGVTTTTTTSNPGQVLGAAVYNFTNNLTVGSNGADVTALQQFLLDNGFSISAGATGYFGAQTKTAVIAYQKANTLPTTGYVGPLTLALLDKGAVATVPEGRTNLSSGQASAIIGFLQAFSADANVIANVKAALGL